MALTGWYETEALLRGGDGDLARAEVRGWARSWAITGAIASSCCGRRRCWRSGTATIDQAIRLLQAALTLAQEIGLPGEAWPILGELGRLYGEQGETVQASAAYREAAALIGQLAETIDEQALAAGFLAAEPVRFVLERNEVTE